MRLSLAIALATILPAACSARPDDAAAPSERPREPIVGLPCEGCELVFEGLPETLAWSARLAPEDEPGEPLRIDGTVRDAAGRPVEGVIVYAYHTDAAGLYPTDGLRAPAAARHGALRGWARSDERGRYRFDTIRPASYPGTAIPAHVHLHVIEVGRCTYYVDDVLFADDPHLTAEQRAQLASGRGGDGVAQPTRDARGVWHVTRDIALGARIPGYPERAE